MAIKSLKLDRVDHDRAPEEVLVHRARGRSILAVFIAHAIP